MHIQTLPDVCAVWALALSFVMAAAMPNATPAASWGPSGTCSPDGKTCHDPFYIKCSTLSGYYGYAQSQNDGQLYCGPNNGLSGCGSDPKPYFTLLSNTGLIDSRGRLAEIVTATKQLEFNLDPSHAASAQPGFGISTCTGFSGELGLSFGGVTTFYVCGQSGSSRIFTGDQVPQSDPSANGCKAVRLDIEYILPTKY